jgi:hypothetical protein
LLNGQVYEVISTPWSTYIEYTVGYFVTQGKCNIFKSYTYARVTTYEGGPNGLRQGTSINKVATLVYSVVEENSIAQVSLKKMFTNRSKDCPALAQYLKEQSPRKNEHWEKVAIFYNENCE